MDNLIFLKVIVIYKIRKEEVNTLVFTLLITFSLVTGVECLIYTTYKKFNITPRNLDDRSVVAGRTKPFPPHGRVRMFIERSGSDRNAVEVGDAPFTERWLSGERTNELNKMSNSRPLRGKGRP